VPGSEDAIQSAEAIPSQPSPVKLAGSHLSVDEEDRPGRRRQPIGTSGKATAALVLGFLALCLNCLTPTLNSPLQVGVSVQGVLSVVLNILTIIPAIVLALLSFRDIKRSRGRLKGKGRAAAGLILGCAGLLCFGVVFYPHFITGPEDRQRITASNNMKQIAFAMHSYNDDRGCLPSATEDPTVQPPMKLSWRVQLLPYLERDNLFRRFHPEEPWDSPHNKALLTPMPKVFAHPKYPEATAQGLTHYRVFVGEHTPFPPGKVARIPASFPKGTPNTILIVEAADPVPWTKPDELSYDPAGPLPRLGGHFCSGFLAATADGQVRIIGPSVSERTLRSAIDPADGRPLGSVWWKGD
jgi:hypothetical protein